LTEALLLRHAKAADKKPGGTDFERPLTAEGERQADRMGRLLAHTDLYPDLIVSSPAARALQTAQRAAEGLGIKPNAIVQDPRIYEAGPLVLLEILSHAVAKAKRPMLVGHNPGFEDLARQLGRLGEDWEFPKGAVARFKAPDKEALRRGSGCQFIELLEP
jgi:phosphohistidine phosphatase